MRRRLAERDSNNKNENVGDDVDAGVN